MLPVEKRIKSKKDLQDFLAADLRYYGKVKKWVYFFQIGETPILVRHQKLLRKTEYYVNTKNRLMEFIYRILLVKFQIKYSIHVPLNCCDKGLRIMHVGSITMNNKACVGENCVFHVNTALVAGGTNNEAPTLGDSVVLGIGATVLGGVTIAKNVAIGAGAVVNKDVLEENIAVAGVPARKISNNGRMAWNEGK